MKNIELIFFVVECFHTVRANDVKLYSRSYDVLKLCL